MIIAEIKGGLGNQMFQYAFAKALSLENKTAFKIDISNYKSMKGDPVHGVRMLGLSYFNINAEIASPEEIKKFSIYRSASYFGKAARLLSRFGTYYKNAYIAEPEENFFSFDKNIFEYPIKKDVYVSGFWQSDQYFKKYEEIIKKEFTLEPLPTGKNKETIEMMRNQNAIAVHIRHGDNANAVAANHGVLPMDYYKKASELIETKVSNPMYYLFSDDIAWAKEQLAYLNPIVVDWNGDDKNHEDMRLIASCKHHIVANSTFSWWGAWLASHREQVVIAPKKYHQTGNQSYPDYYPKHWNII